jgi:hypothetical protein
MNLKRRMTLALAGLAGVAATSLGTATAASADSYNYSANVACWYRYYSNGALTGQYSYVHYRENYSAYGRRIDTVYVSAAPDGGSYVAYWNELQAQEHTTSTGAKYGDGVNWYTTARTGYAFGPTSTNAMPWRSSGSTGMYLWVSLRRSDNNAYATCPHMTY